MKRAREALNGVTDGPWLALDYTDADEPRWHVLPPDKHGTIASLNLEREADAHFIAAARDLVPDMADRIEELEAKLAKAVEGFEDLARLGNGDRYGNSLGNMIAREYLSELTGGKDYSEAEQ